MSTIDPENNNEHSGEEYRNKVISSFPLSKQFLIRTQLSNTEALTKEQAIELLKEMIVQSAYKDEVYKNLMRTTI